ncbi:hypothetical protein [Actinoallomurus bryophytorum]|uniref:hypothetical protein n=1 Tax=Actinoallomurus bryophytorum TaxID=1490222 RepID=UPI0011535159|nr:hypothetical protein [Actinoallomurus bryophytorum]
MAKILGEADTVLALTISIIAGVLGLTSVTSASVTQNAILVTLGILSISILRDRWRRSDAIERTVSVLQNFTSAATEIEQVKSILEQVQVALASQSLTHILTTAEQVASEHTQARESSGRWLFRGGTGTYIRAVTLPGLIKSARRERRPLHVRLEILDPTNEDVCERYARFRSSVSPLPDGTGQVWTTQRTQLESYATLLAACWYQADYTLLDIKVGLVGTMGIFRYDLSDSRLVITQDDGFAMVVPQEGLLYSSYETELRTSFEQARHVQLDAAKQIRLSSEPTVGEAVDLFKAIGVPLVVSHDLIADIITKAIHAQNPYI